MIMLIYDDFSKKCTSYSKSFFLKVFKLKASVRVGIIEPTEPSDTVIYKSFFKHCVLQTILHEFLLLIFMWNKIFCSKN